MSKLEPGTTTVGITPPHLQVLGSRGAVLGNRIFSEILLGEEAFMEVPGVYLDSADIAYHPFCE